MTTYLFLFISQINLTHSTYQVLEKDKTSKKKRKRVALTTENKIENYKMAKIFVLKSFVVSSLV